MASQFHFDPDTYADEIRWERGDFAVVRAVYERAPDAR
jgi:hypothetical protein